MPETPGQVPFSRTVRNIHARITTVQRICSKSLRSRESSSMHHYREAAAVRGNNPPISTWRTNMIIVSGKIFVDAADRDAYLEDCHQLIELARSSSGCLDFHLSGDPVEPDRINVYEQWETAADVEAFRGSGPTSDQQTAIRDAQVFQHEIASSHQL